MDRRVSAAAAVLTAAIAEHAALLATLEETLGPDIVRAADWVSKALAGGGQVLLCGNGGSAADAQHIAGEFVGRFLRERRALPALALHANTTVITAIGNDYSYESIYARQVEAHGRAGDVLIGITTSGNSANIVQAAIAARQAGIRVIGLTGAGGGKLREHCDLCLCVPSRSTPRIQEMHILIGHVLCQIAEDDLA